MIEFFLRRPIFAAVCSIIIVLAGIVTIPTLPIAQFPKVAPPVVTVTATYTGASSQAVESSVTIPLENAINGVQGLRYMTSQSSNNGTSTITCTFALERDLDAAANDVQNAIQTAQGDLPSAVTQNGITVAKNSGAFVMGMGFTSHSAALTPLIMSNYVDLYVKNDLKRLKGVSDVIIFGERHYAMRIWLDPKRMVDNQLAVTDINSTLQDQNVEVAAGSIGSPPTNGHQPYQYSIRATGRLSTPEQFGALIVKSTPNGGHVFLRDVARIELGAQDYSADLKFNGKSSVGIGVLALPSSNALDVSREVSAEMLKLKKDFPAGMNYEIAFDVTTFVNESIHEVVITLLIAIVLVVIVIYLFLQDWRTTLIPAITIPVSLIGTFALMKALGFSINTLTLFGLTLATGLVVDDAIVVIENIARFVQEKKMTAMEGASAAMAEITSAVVATSLVLLAVFIPVAFFPGTTGQLYKQFALTIACSISISLFNALTLTPTLSALLLGHQERPRSGFFVQFNRFIAWLRLRYHSLLGGLLGGVGRYVVLAGFALALLLTGYMFTSAPTGFTPDEDQGYFITIVQLPEGASLDQTEVITAKVEQFIRQRPEALRIFTINGFAFTGNAPNQATIFVLLKDWKDRPGLAHSVLGLLYGKGGLQSKFGTVAGAQIFGVNPPAINGVGNVSGFQYELEDRGNVGLDRLTLASQQFEGAAYQDPHLSQVYTTFRNNNPQIVVDPDREKAASLNVPLANIFSTMQVYLGSLYVNDFDYLNRSYRVYVEADTPYRNSISDLSTIYVRANPNPDGSLGPIMPLSTLIQYSQQKSAPIIYHYNLFRSIELSGKPGQGYGSGQAISAMENIAKKVENNGIGHEWSGISLDEIEAGSSAALIFSLGIIVVFLVLAAQYESWSDPLIILMSVPLAILGALIFVFIYNIFHIVIGDFFGLLQSDVYAQVGYLMLIGLASKNAILIVEFANQLRAEGLSAVDAAKKAAETRLRPILMTSFAFILGILPLVISSGAGSASRHSLGAPVFGGMILSTFLNLLLVPVIYVLMSSIVDRGKPKSYHGHSAGTPTNGHAVPAGTEVVAAPSI